MGGTIRIAVETFPPSAALRDLLAEEEHANALLSEAIPQVSAGTWTLLACRPVGVRKKMRKVIASYDITYADEGGVVRTDPVIVKVYGSDRGGNGHDSLKRLWEAGFRAPADLRVPRPYGYSQARFALVQQRATGVPWADHLGRDEAAVRQASERAADWLLALQKLSVGGEPRPVDGAEVERYVENLASAYPDAGGEVQRLGARLTAELTMDEDSPLPSHGDFHPKNVFVTNGVVTTIDFDTFGLRDPAADVGYAIGQLLVMSQFRLGSVLPGAEAAFLFWQRYRQKGPARWRRVTLQVARTFLQSLHYELCVLQNRRTEIVGPWLDLIGYWLDAEEDALEGLIRNR